MQAKYTLCTDIELCMFHCDRLGSYVVEGNHALVCLKQGIQLVSSISPTDQVQYSDIRLPRVLVYLI